MNILWSPQISNTREQLKKRGFKFCDDHIAAKGGSESKNIFKSWENQNQKIKEETIYFENVIKDAIAASTTDFPNQNIDNTLNYDNYTFWSSSGDVNEDTNEWLLYELKHPICILHSLNIKVYRDTHHQGSPLYPPKYIQILIGMTPNNLHIASDKMEVQPCDNFQYFRLFYPNQPLGKYLKIQFYGKAQLQLFDWKYYIAIESIDAFGLPLSQSELTDLCFKLKSEISINGPTYIASILRRNDGHKKSKTLSLFENYLNDECDNELSNDNSNQEEDVVSNKKELLDIPKNFIKVSIRKTKKFKIMDFCNM